MLLMGMYIFHDPEGLLLSHTFVHFFRDPEGSLPSHTVRAFLPRSRRFASVVHASRFFRFPEGSLPLRSAFLPFCQSSEEYRQCVERKVCFARRANCQFPHVRPKPIEYQLTIQRAQLSSVLKIHAGTFHSWIPQRMLTRCAFHNLPKLTVSFASSRPSFLSGHLPSAFGSCDLST